jgi:predicted acetyltransferase
MSGPELIALNHDEYSFIENLALYYEYDMSRYCGELMGWEFPQQGPYHSQLLVKNLKSYFKEKERYPFLIKINEHPAGFVMVNKVGTTPEVDWNMGEFFIAAPYQRKKIGHQIAIEVFNQFQGTWEIAVIPQNTGAYKFWQPLIASYAKGVYTQEQKQLYVPEPHQMIIFRFKSQRKA